MANEILPDEHFRSLENQVIQCLGCAWLGPRSAAELAHKTWIDWPH